MGTTSILRVRVGDLRGKMNLTGTGHAKSTVAIDYPPPLGEDNGFTSLELLMVSLASCSSHSLKYVLAKHGIQLEDITVNATGQRRMDEHPTLLTKIELEYQLFGKDLSPAAIDDAMRVVEEKMCPVWAMLRGQVEIVWKYSIRTESASA